MTRTSPGHAIDHAVGFLREAQLGHGEFMTLLGSDKSMSNPVFDMDLSDPSRVMNSPWPS